MRAEPRLLPALLVLAAVAAVAAGLAARNGLIVWLLVFTANAGARALLGARVSAALQAPQRHVGVWAWGLSHAVELALWAGLLLTLPAGATGVLTAAAAGFALLISALTLGQARALWLPYALAAVLIAAVVALRDPSMTLPALGFVVWMGALAWVVFGAARLPAARRALALGPSTISVPTLSSPTRLAWRSVVTAMPSPMIVLRQGQVEDVNEAAAQFIGRDARTLIGLRAGDCLRLDPESAIDPLDAGSERSAHAVPAERTFDDVAPWPVRVRVMSPGVAASRVLLVLSRPAVSAPPADRWADDALRLAGWIGALDGQPWYRDERGRLFLPDAFQPELAAPVPSPDFPLADRVPERDRAQINARYRAAREQRRPFDAVVPLLDRMQVAQPVRVICLERAAEPGQLAPVIGVIAAAGAMDRPDDDVLERLPLLAWAVDRRGQLTRVQGRDGWRWGMVASAQVPQPWHEAFAFTPDAARDLLRALRSALRGQPTFDLVNSRTTARGGRVVLRSHVVPGQVGDGSGALVLDTIASPQQLAEIDRLRRGKAQYKALVDASASLIWACDERFRFTFVSKRAARDIYGREPAELIGQPITVLLAPQAEQMAARQALARLRLGEHLREFEMVHQARDGQRVVVAVTASPLRGGDGHFGGALGLNADLTMLKQRERRLTEALRVERTVLDAAGQAIAVVKDSMVQRCNDAFVALVQQSPAQLARSPVSELFVEPEAWGEIAAAADSAQAGDRAAARELLIRCGRRSAAGGATTTWCQLTARAIAPTEYVIVLADIDHIRLREAEAQHHAQHDELTGLPNRRLLAARAAMLLSARGTGGGQCAVVAIDLDGFKDINDRHGHGVGDATLREVAQRLSRVLRPQDTVARRGGDEFAMLIPDISGRLEVERIAQRVLQTLAAPFSVAQHESAQLSASLGIALAPAHGRDLERLLHLADQAMYQAKSRGKNRAEFAPDAPAGNVTVLPTRAARLNGQ